MPEPPPPRCAKELTSNEGLLQIPKYDYSKWNLWRPISKFQEMTQLNWLSLLYACVDPNELHCAPSDFSPGRQSASHECYFLKVAQLLMVDTCGDMETMMDPLPNEAITHGSPLKNSSKHPSKIPKNMGENKILHLGGDPSARMKFGCQSLQTPWNQGVSLSIGISCKNSLCKHNVKIRHLSSHVTGCLTSLISQIQNEILEMFVESPGFLLAWSLFWSLPGLPLSSSHKCFSQLTFFSSPSTSVSRATPNWSTGCKTAMIQVSSNRRTWIENGSFKITHQKLKELYMYI